MNEKSLLRDPDTSSSSPPQTYTLPVLSHGKLPNKKVRTSSQGQPERLVLLTAVKTALPLSAAKQAVYLLS